MHHSTTIKHLGLVAVASLTLGLFVGCVAETEDTATIEAKESASELAPSANNDALEQAGLRWTNAGNGYVPPNAIAGGYEPGRILYVCRGNYENGVHPGKIVGSNCNIGWGGKERLLPYYQVLVGDPSRIRWEKAGYGFVPSGAFSGGYEPGRPALYVCRVNYKGIHPGKLVGQNCNIGYGGNELTFPEYEVMVVE